MSSWEVRRSDLVDILHNCHCSKIGAQFNKLQDNVKKRTHCPES